MGLSIELIEASVDTLEKLQGPSYEKMERLITYDEAFRKLQDFKVPLILQNSINRKVRLKKFDSSPTRIGEDYSNQLLYQLYMFWRHQKCS